MPGALTLSFVPLNSATRSVGGADTLLDIGPVSAEHRAGRAPAIIVRRRVAVRIDTDRGSAASARLSVALASELPGSTMRVDGMTISTVPRMINPAHRIGSAVVHEIELTIPASVPAGAFASDLQWRAETD
jgi:hypothetical protein